jgi:Tol biopolymer transport system component
VKSALVLMMVIGSGFISGCTSGAAVLTFPFDAGGRSLNSPFTEHDPQVAGRYIVFASDRRGSEDIYLFDAAERRLLDLPGLNALDMVAMQPAVSQDGQTIAFLGIRRERSDVYLYNRSTTQLRNLTENLQAEVRKPSLSADGTAIAFEASINGQWDILVYNRSGQPLNVPFDPR